MCCSPIAENSVSAVWQCLDLFLIHLCVWCPYHVKSSLFFFFTWQKVTEEKYEIKVAYEEAAIKIVTTTDPKVVVTITLTSPVMREGEESEHGRCFFVLFLQPQGPK